MSRAWIRGGILFLVAVVGGVVAWGQTEALHADGPLPSFEAAVIRQPDLSHPVRVYPPGVTEQTYITGRLKMLIALAYHVSVVPKYFGVLNAPDWTDKTNYTIHVKIPGEIFEKMQKMTLRERRDEQDLMTQSLLAERFKLKVHFERRGEPVYDLVIAKGGPKLPPPIDSTPGPPSADGKPEANLFAGASLNPKTGVFIRRNLPLDSIFRVVCCGMDGRPVVNKTGLTGNYTVTLNLGLGTSDDNGQVTEGSIFSMAEEQLGLKLIPSKAMVEVVVVDHVEMPTEN
jgi:uncharacterized protein (TIGR03435 family)